MTWFFIKAYAEDVGFVLMMAALIFAPQLVIASIIWLVTNIGRPTWNEEDYEDEIFIHDGTAPGAMREAAVERRIRRTGKPGAS